MRSLKFTATLLLLLTITNSLFISLAAAEPSGSDPTNEDFPYVGRRISLRGASHFLPRVPLARCDRNPRICSRARGKRDCCKKRCVDLTED
ncbi:Unknown protein, partial [Striga hermonthica]